MREKTLVDWFMPSIADVLFLSFFFKLLSDGSSLLDDGDTGWHILTGENILRTLRIPFIDPYSHSVPGTPWTAHEWLAEVVFGVAHRLMGLNGVVLLSTAVITLTFFFLYLFMLNRRISAVVAVAVTILAAWVSMLHWLARPHVFSLPLTLAFVAILDLYQRKRVNRLVLLPLLMVFWVNLHGGYVLGLALVFLYAAGNFLRLIAARGNNEAAMKACKAVGITAVLTLLATFVNPHGPAILYFPFHLVGRAFIMDNVVEWLSPNFHQQPLFEFMLLSFIAIFALSKRKLDLFEGSIAFLLIGMSLYSVRYIPLLAIAVSPMAAARAGEVLDDLAQSVNSIRVVMAVETIIRKISDNVTSLEARFRHHLWIYVAIGACALIAVNGGKFGKTQLMDYKQDPSRFPADALDFALNNDVNGNMFNNDGWGGYIIYKSYPQYKVFVDGRSDMYGVSLLKEYMQVSAAKLGYEEILEKYGVTWIIHNANAPICQLLATGGRWKLVYADATANILLKDIPENHRIIEKYKGVEFVRKREE